MLRNKLYYRIKPLLPWSLRVTIRRLFAHRRRALASETWPIMPGSEKPPANWPGWPGGKKFALVLTHDVERSRGLANCRKLMQLEMDLGLRSCFNFVPESDYAISRPLREELVQNGFEVGVHDLRHDGMLYHSRREFVKRAARINKYLKDWRARGFRSGFMLHNLDWLHDLEVQYDSSTFDTDPFEPQPDGVGTIFPFWVPRPNGNRQLGITDYQSLLAGERTLNHQPSTINHSNGYVELPYTLPQDSTLFLLFRERTPAVWFQKLDWIAKHGGMALIVTHPDYMNFNGAPNRSDEYKVSHYEALLDYAQKRYQGQFWQALPAEVAEVCNPNLREKRNISMTPRSQEFAEEAYGIDCSH